MAYFNCFYAKRGSAIPDGATVTPTDDIQTLLNCANIWNKSYTTLSELLADTTTLSAVISSNNAIDYLVRSTTWATDMCADSTAMAYIGLNNYASNTLLADLTWASAICNSTYFESVLNVKVPVMTDNTTPSGECFGTTYYVGNDYYKAFDENNSDNWSSSVGNYTNQRCAYHFPTPVCVKMFRTKNNMPLNNTPFLWKNYKIQGSDDKFVSDVHDLYTGVQPQTSGYDTGNIIINNNTKYSDYGILCVDSYRTEAGHSYISGLALLQFYGRADV